MQDSIDNISHYPLLEQLDSISYSLTKISQNTDSWYDWSSSIVSVISVIASIATIIGFITLYWEWKKHQMSKDCQREIILDLIRHMFINNVILEVIRGVCERNKYECRPIEGVFARFATLDSDTDLGRLSTSSKHYAKIHSVNSILRNYNIAVNIAEKHFNDPSCHIEIRKDDIREIVTRSRRIAKELLELGQILKLGVTTELASNHIRKYYSKYLKLPLNQEEAERILPRNEFKEHDYFDQAMNLTDVMDCIINKRYKDIYFIFNNESKPRVEKNTSTT